MLSLVFGNWWKKLLDRVEKEIKKKEGKTRHSAVCLSVPYATCCPISCGGNTQTRSLACACNMASWATTTF